MHTYIHTCTSIVRFIAKSKSYRENKNTAHRARVRVISLCINLHLNNFYNSALASFHVLLSRFMLPTLSSSLISFASIKGSPLLGTAAAWRHPLHMSAPESLGSFTMSASAAAASAAAATAAAAAAAAAQQQHNDVGQIDGSGVR